jgi:diguanylate cyclase (GGDEF)-like protein/PAS domain S-box-containing protein
LAAPARIFFCFVLITVAVSIVRHLEHLQSSGHFYWTANGILLAYLLLAPRWRWPFYLAAGLGGLTLGGILAGEGWQQSVVENGLNLLEILIAAGLLRKRSGKLLRLTERWHILRFLTYGVVLGPAVTAVLLGLLDAYLQHSWIMGMDPAFKWLIGDGLGIAITTPAFLAILSLRPHRQSLRKNWTPAVLLLLLTWLSFSQNQFPLHYFIYPMLVLVLVRLGLGYASLTLLISSTLTFYLTLNGHGPYAALLLINPILAAMMLEEGVAAAIVLLYTVSVLVESRTKAERSLEHIAALHNLMTENSRDGIIVANFDGTWRYISPFVFSMTGYTPEYIENRALFDFVHPEDAPRVIQAFSEQRLGHESALLEWRVRRANGEYIWVEGNICPLRNAHTAKIEGVLCFARDVTDRKLAEQRLQEAYRTVETLAITDALTGISNRRRFDQVLPREWRHALRNRTPLTMLLLDVDLFKLYNDTYGHLRGDSCLRQIAESILDVVSRADDLVARYGGEEFAVLLPGTPQEGGLEVARKINEALTRRHLEHSKSPFGFVSVSIGCATIVPHLGQQALTLVDLSDKALYEAKEQGRNRIRSTN